MGLRDLRRRRRLAPARPDARAAARNRVARERPSGRHPRRDRAAREAPGVAISLDAPVRECLERLSSSPAPASSEIVAARAVLSSDADYFAPMIAQIDAGQMDGFPLHVPDRGPRLFFLHRPRGVMSAVHSHNTWIAVARVAGVETHRTFEVIS